VSAPRFPRFPILAGASLAIGLAVGLAVGVTVGRRGPANGWSPTEAQLFYEPTPPVPVARVLPETAPTAALVVALPEAQVLGNARKEAFFARLIATAARYVQVVVLVNRDESLSGVAIRELIARHAREADSVLAQVTFLPGAIDSEWIRDYGPLFAIGADGELVLLDNMYRDVRAEAHTERTLSGLGLVQEAEGPAPDRDVGGGEGAGGPYLSDYGHFWRRNDDAAALHINEILYSWRRRFAPLVRPPLQLSGGDLAFTGGGQLFASTRALEVNGGDERRLSRLAREYFNADSVTYLRPLPNGMWHIDMFFRIARPSVVMLGEFADAGQAGSAHLRLVRRKAMETLEWNRALIEERLPGVEVIRVPMPPIVAPARRRAGGGKTGLPALDAALEASRGTVRPLATVLYRSFLNSVYVDGGSGRSAVLVPRFAGLRDMEPEVEAAYRRAYPGADVHFIEADVLAEEFAGIHCLTLTIPAMDGSPAVRGRR
jgi:agmatine/peptidylarginine deiminase